MSHERNTLIAELCRAFNAKKVGMICAMSHGLVTVDGYIVRPEHDRRWTPDQLRGRYARFYDRQAQLYGSKVVHE